MLVEPRSSAEGRPYAGWGGAILRQLEREAPTINVTLSSEAEQLVREEVASGRYDSAQEVVREGLRLLHERGIVEKQRRARLNEQIEEGLSQLDRGEGIPGDQAFQALWEKSRKRRETS